MSMIVTIGKLQHHKVLQKYLSPSSLGAGCRTAQLQQLVLVQACFIHVNIAEHLISLLDHGTLQQPSTKDGFFAPTNKTTYTASTVIGINIVAYCFELHPMVQPFSGFARSAVDLHASIYPPLSKSIHILRD